MAKKKTKAKPKMKKKAAATPKRKVAAKKKAPARKAVSRPKPARRNTAPRRSSASVSKQSKSSVVPPGSNAVTPILVVRNMNSAIQFYTNGLGFTLRSSMPGPDGQAMHAELTLHNSLIMLGPEAPDRGSFAPQAPSPVTLYVFAENVDEVAARAAGLGGNLVMPPMDMFWGDRCAMVVDPEGHRWMIATHVKDLTPQEMMDAASEAMPAAQPTT